MPVERGNWLNQIATGINEALHPELRVARILKERGWEVEIKDRQTLIPLAKGAELNCGDGRSTVEGPALFGGFWGVMALRTGGDRAGAIRALELIRDSGYMPGIHTDEHGIRQDPPNELNCGFYNLWRNASLSSLTYDYKLQPQDEADLLRNLATVTVSGEHTEGRLYVNMVADHTVQPNPTRFRLDAWLAKKLGIDLDRLINVSAQTIETLTRENPVKRACIIV